MNIIDNRSKTKTPVLEEGAIVVADSGRKYLVIRDVLNNKMRLLDVAKMETAYHFEHSEFTLEYVSNSVHIEEIIPAAQVQLTIGGTN